MILLKQLISNILGNAIKFTSLNGSITITATSHILKIADTGIGIDEKSLPYIFNRFYQEDESRSANFGTGLGLALVKRIVDIHNWTIDIKSVKKKGTTCTVHFGH